MDRPSVSWKNRYAYRVYLKKYEKRPDPKAFDWIRPLFVNFYQSLLLAGARKPDNQVYQPGFSYQVSYVKYWYSVTSGKTGIRSHNSCEIFLQINFVTPINGRY